MSKHSSPALTMRDALYEAPGPKMRAKIRIGTAISLVAVSKPCACTRWRPIPTASGTR